MSFRARLTLVAAAAVALAVVLASAVVYLVVRDQLRGPIDDGLKRTAAEISEAPPSEIGRALFHLQGELGGAPGYPQVVRSNGATILPPGLTVSLPVNDRAKAVANGKGDTFLQDAHVAGTHVRMVTFPYAPGYAVQVARPLDEVDHTLSRIRLFLILIAVGGIGVAAALGLLVSRAALAPVRRLTMATENVAETRDLSERIETGQADELGRLAGSFNEMMAALEEAERLQRQLVADASHELRTPLTSLRTNIEVLARADHYTPEERERVISAVAEQLEEMTVLVAELVELARGDEGQDEPEDVRLDLLVAGAVERTRRRAPGIEFSLDLEESVVEGVPSRLERAVGNLLDNAVKWSPPGGIVEVSVRNAKVCVRDHGPGIEEEDLPFVFDRFYRAKVARGLPGSGLGLAIVRKVAEAHRGEVGAERAEGGGTLITLRLDGRPSVTGPEAPPSS
jgi:two-component system, OmpR family, sensor histidine kinase MprB